MNRITPDTILPENSSLDQRVAYLKQTLARRDQEIARLRAEAERYRIIADFTYDWEYWLMPDGSYQYVSPACESITGYRPDEFQSDPDLLERIVHPADRSLIARHLSNEQRDQYTSELHFRIITRDGADRWIGHACQPVYSASGEWQGRRASNRDITAQKQLEEAYRVLVENSLQALVIFQDGRNRFANPAAARITGYTQEELLAMSPEEANAVIHPDDRVMLAERAKARQRGEDVPPNYEFRLFRKDGALRWLECFNTLIEYQGRPAVQMAYIDITDRKQAEAQFQQLKERLQQQAIHDALTGLYNRRYLDETLPRELQRATRHEQPVGVIMLDIDHFKRFNDTYGHDAGDTLLREVGELLRLRTRGEDIACRYGGEEFTLVLPGATLDDTRQRAEQIRAGIEQLTVQHREQLLDTITVSLGVAVFPAHGCNADDVMKTADNALYRAKYAGRNRVVVAGTGLGTSEPIENSPYERQLHDTI